MTNKLTSFMDYLPKEIKDVISSYNSEHRPSMKLVLDQMMTRYFPESTQAFWRREYYLIVREIPHRIYCHTCYIYKPINQIDGDYCSEECQEEDCRRYDEHYHRNDYYDACDDYY
jgi:hypothetical protein